MSSNREIFLFSCLEILILLLVIYGVLAYYTSGFTSRFVLIVTFLFIQVALMWQGLKNGYKIRKKLVFSLFLLSSLFFLLWRYSFFAPYYMERHFHREVEMLSQRYSETGHLFLDSAHSYFFLEPLVLHFLSEICGSSLLGDYLLILVSAILLAFICTLVLKTLVSQEQIGKGYNCENFTLPYAIAFSLASFAWSERGKLPTFLFLLAIWLVLNGGLKNLRKNVILILLIVGVTFGHTTGFLILISFFFLFPIFNKRSTAILYALIPITYLIFAAYSYVLSLKTYAVFAWEGLQEFLGSVIGGHIPERITPWHRVTSLGQNDIYITSAAYISLLLVSSLTALISMCIWLKERNKIRNKEDAYLWAGSAYLWFWLGIVVMTYIGASTKHETSFSDVRTIVVIFISLLLPFILTSKRLIERINARKVFVLFITALLILASLKTIYEIYPKSIYDPINVVEDNRLGSTGIYVITDFIAAYYISGGIIADYKVLNRIGYFLSEAQYEKRLLNEMTLNKPFARFPYQSILIFNTAGTIYPSVYHSQEAYIAAHNFSLLNNRIYDNGIVVISSALK